jgi:hypothetical protein
MKTRMFKPALALAALVPLLLIGAQSQAAIQRDVECANGKTVTATDTQSDAAVCLTVGSKPAAARRPGTTKYSNITLKRSAADEAKAKKYERLAAQHKPRTPDQEKVVKEYMKLPAVQRIRFKADHPQVQKSIWDYGPYAVCFYASVAGGADVVEAGDECHEDWVN